MGDSGGSPQGKAASTAYGSIDRTVIAREAAQAAKWSLVDKWGVRLLSLASFSVLAYLLSPEAFGVVATAQVIIALLQTVTDQGVPKALVVQRVVTDSMRNTALWMTLAMASVASLTLVATSSWMAELLGMEELKAVLPALAVFLILRALGAVPEALAQREMRFRSLAVRSISAAVISSAVGVCLALLGMGVWALVGQALVQASVSTVLLWVLTRFRVGRQISRKAARELINFGWKVGSVDVLTVVVTQSDKFIVGVLLGPAALGYYVIAHRVLAVAVDALTGAISALALPVFSRISSDVAATKAALTRATQLSLTIATPTFLLIALTAPVIVPLLFGSQYQQSVLILQIICVTGILSSVTRFDRGVLLAAHRADLELGLVIVMAVGTILAALLGAQIGLEAVAVAMVGRILLTWPVRLFALRRAISLEVRTYTRAWQTPVLAGVSMLMVGLGTQALLGDASPVLTSGIAAALGLACYLGYFALFDRTILRRGLELAKLA